MLVIMMAVALGSVSYEPAETMENAQAFLKAAMETAHDGNPRSQPRVVNRPCVSEIHDDYFFRGQPTIINWRRVNNVRRGSHPKVYLDVGQTGQGKCPYCGTVYQLKEGEHFDAHH